MQFKIKDIVDASFLKMLAWREHLHAHPELSFQEINTSAFVASNLEELGIPYQHGIAGTGVVALIKGRNPEKHCIALRADLDALPIHEENEVPYKSKKQGVMHACGHDVHTTCLLGAAYVLNQLKNEFQKLSQCNKKYLQQFLKGQGLYFGGIDGRWGNGTNKAVSAALKLPTFKNMLPNAFFKKIQQNPICN